MPDLCSALLGDQSHSLKPLIACFVLLGLQLPFPFDILSQADMLVGYEFHDERVTICIEVPKQLGVRLNDRSP